MLDEPEYGTAKVLYSPILSRRPIDLRILPKIMSRVSVARRVAKHLVGVSYNEEQNAPGLDVWKRGILC